MRPLASAVQAGGEAPAGVYSVDVLNHPEGIFKWVATSANAGLWTISGLALANDANALTVRFLAQDGTVLSSVPFTVTFTGNGSPLPRLRDLEAGTYEQLLRTNVIAPQQLIRSLLPTLSPHAVVINISSDAGVDHYENWGGYGSSKAALDHQTVTWAAEEPQFTWYSLDPSDMRTAMHQAAFPGEDISDRPEPETVAPLVVALIGSGLPSGRYRSTDLATTLATPMGSA